MAQEQKIVVAGLALAFVCVGGACGKDCTLVNCSDAVVIEIRASDGSALDTFAGQIDLDDLVIPLSCVDGTGGDSEYACQPGGIRLLNPGGVKLLKSGDSLQVSIEASDEEFTGTADVDVTDTYRPNGESCPPECMRGTARVDLS